MSDTTNSADLPEDIDLNLDDLDREYDSKRPKVEKPYRVQINGRVITFTDPAEVSWRNLARIENPLSILGEVITEEDRQHLREADFPGWKMGKLYERFSKHYGFDFDDAKGKADLPI